MHERPSLVSPLLRLAALGEQSVHGSDGGQVDATTEQRGVDLVRRLVDKLRAMQHVHHRGAFLVADASWAQGHANAIAAATLGACFDRLLRD